jgi:hypothetical protein
MALIEDTGSSVPWKEIEWTLHAVDAEDEIIFRWVQYSTRCQSSGTPARAFTVVSLGKVMSMQYMIRPNVPNLFRHLQYAMECRMSGSAACLAITYDFEGHADRRVHMMPRGVHTARPSKDDLIARSFMPTKGEVIVSHTLCGHTELTYFNQSGITRPRVSECNTPHISNVFCIHVVIVDPVCPTRDEQAWQDKFAAKAAIMKGELSITYDKPAGVVVATPDAWHGHNAMLEYCDIYGAPIQDGWRDDATTLDVIPTDGVTFLLHSAAGKGDDGVGGVLPSSLSLRHALSQVNAHVLTCPSILTLSEPDLLHRHGGAEQVYQHGQAVRKQPRADHDE